MVLPAGAWRRVSWREGTAGTLAARFAAVRIRPAHRDTDRVQPRAEERLLVEWPEGAKEPTRYWLSTLPEATGTEELVATAKRRWRIERDFEELKQELGLGHFEGRSGAPLPTARLLPPRCLMHRGLRFPGGRALPFFPSWPAATVHRPRAACGLPGARLTWHDPSGTARPPSPPCAGISPSR
jgi:hypothetical protein